MKRFVEGTDRGQNTLFPECLQDWICEDNPVRAIDVEELARARMRGDHPRPATSSPLATTSPSATSGSRPDPSEATSTRPPTQRHATFGDQ